MTVIATSSSTFPLSASTLQLTLDNNDTQKIPLKEKRRQLRLIQGQLVEIEHAKVHLEKLLPGTTHVGKSSSSPSSWRVASDTQDALLAGEIKVGEVLVPISRIAFIPAQLQRPHADHSIGTKEDEMLVYIRGTDTLLKSSSAVLHPLASVKSLEGYEQMTVSRALAYLIEKRGEVERRAAILREEVVTLARATLAEHLSVNPETSSNGVTSLDAEGQAVNEEGLPFVDPVEPLSENKTVDAVPPLSTFERESMSKEARRRYMDSIFNQIEAEEGLTSSESTMTSSSSASAKLRDARPASHRRVSSADRPAPVKSVLKQTAPVPPPLPRFGSSGIRRGFLNLNPSSPAAERSSDPIQSFNFGQPLSRSNSVAAESTTSAASDDSTREERMSRSVELPTRSSIAQQRRKKTVRIQSPVREIAAPNSPNRPSDVNEVNVNAKEDVKDEARSILELLGLEAVKDHPQAAKDGEKMRQPTENAESARLTAENASRERAQKPAVSQSVLERSQPSRSERNDTSAFRKGFLNGNDSTSVPNTPRISKGISALDRASQSDKGLEVKRAAQGLKPIVPHARPSKAFAAKLEAKRQGQLLQQEEHDDDQSDEEVYRKSRVRFGEDAAGRVQVQVGTAASSASSNLSHHPVTKQDEDDGSLDAIGMQIRDEDLDEETVEALGYFSDEDYDPDIGWDENDLPLSRPNFTSDAESISNEELRKEYERIKASLGNQLNGSTQGSSKYNEDEENGFIEGADLTMQDENENEGPKVSRFKQDRAKRKLLGQTLTSTELGTGLDKAVNAGPSMLIPSIANVRYPKPGQVLTEGREIELDGESDNDDGLEEAMRQRLSQWNTKEDKLKSHPVERVDAPPTIVASDNQPAAKKTSLFKSRMRQN